MVDGVEIAVGHDDHHLHHLLAEVDLVVLHRLTLEGPEIAEVRRNQVPAPGNADVAGCRASIVQGVDTVVQLLLIAGEGEDLVIETTRSEEHTSELQSLMRISYAVYCLKKKKQIII